MKSLSLSLFIIGVIFCTFQISFGNSISTKVQIDSLKIAVNNQQSLPSKVHLSKPEIQPLFKTERLNVFIFLIIISALVLTFLFLAKRNHSLTLRKIAGLDAIDEAVGRAAEMGRPVLFVPGSMDVDRIQTLAGIAILSKVGYECATYEVDLDVMTRFPLLMSTSQEILRQSYLTAGRPDLFSPDRVQYITDNQFAFAAAITGHMVRVKTAAHFFIGEFYAESLVISEAGNTTGAIQIAGTANSHQLPFFLASCDYTLIGEELFAASAYLSREPILLGTILGQDWSKALFGLLIVLGTLAAWFGWTDFIHWFQTE
ncbi:MAG: hypothetical protein N2450_00305 [bacterium]|nr:hypothetical protein [bacterium]